MLSSRSFLLLVSSAFSLSAQGGNVGMPVLGFTFDSSQGTIRALRGIPGAALVDDPLDTGFPIASAAISPGRDYALAVSSADRQLRLVSLQNPAAPIPISGVTDPAERIVFSPSGRSALLYRRSGPAQVLTGLPDNLSVRDLSLPDLDGGSAALAISDDGMLAAISAGREETDAVWLAAPDGTPRQLPLSAATALAFREGAHDLLSVSAQGDVYLVRSLDSTAEYRLVYSGDPGISGSFAVRFSTNGTQAYAASHRGRLTVIDLNGGSATALDCGCHPEGLEPLALQNVFRLTSVSTSPVMLLDASTAGARVWFVPSRETWRKEGSEQ
jgi:hypothetical protein